MADNTEIKDTKVEDITNSKQKIVKGIRWKNPTKQKIEVTLAGKGISFLPGEVITFEDPTTIFGKNTRLIKL